MRVAVTGGTGFIGRYILDHLVDQGHEMQAWYRPSSGDPPEIPGVHWVAGDLTDESSFTDLVKGCHALIHAALWLPGRSFRGGEGDPVEFCRTNVVGSLALIEAAKRAGVSRIVYVSTCAVHERILEDRPLDESHPTWPTTHYGAHKAAMEMFIHSYGWGQDVDICAIRPTGVYGVVQSDHRQSKWFEIVKRVKQGQSVVAEGGGKEVHAADVAKAIGILLTAPDIAGRCFNCYDRYVSSFEVATIAHQLTGSKAQVQGEKRSPKHQIDTGAIQQLGMTFGGEPLLRQTIEQLVKLA